MRAQLACRFPPISLLGTRDRLRRGPYFLFRSLRLNPPARIEETI